MIDPRSGTDGSSAAPRGVRVAGTLTMLVGATTLIAAIADFARTAGVDPDAGLRLAIGGASGFGAAIAGALIRRQLRLGVFVLELSWLTAVAAVLLTGARMGANVPLTIVLFVAAANWRALR